MIRRMLVFKSKTSEDVRKMWGDVEYWRGEGKASDLSGRFIHVCSIEFRVCA